MNTKHLLGTILQASGLLNRQEIDQILQAQAKSQQTGDKYLPFGEVALHLKLVTVHQLRAALEVQKRLVFQSEEAKRLGFYMLESKLIKPDALVQALEKQRDTQAPLERVLVELELVSAPVMQSVLQELARRTPPRPQPPAGPPKGPEGAAPARVPSPAAPPSAPPKPPTPPQAGAAPQPAPPRRPPTMEDLQREIKLLKDLVNRLHRENAALKARLAELERP